MKAPSKFRLLLPAIILMLVASCNKVPQLFSVNSLADRLSDSGSLPTVSILPVKGITGRWTGIEHTITIGHGRLLSNIVSYHVLLIDTCTDIDHCDLPDSSAYDMIIIKVSGQPYLEVISSGTHNSGHDFTLPLCTWLKLNKLTADTIVVQMPGGRFVENYLRAHGYKYFTPVSFREDDMSPVYLTETPERMATLLQAFNRHPEAFQQPDTLLRVR